MTNNKWFFLTINNLKFRSVNLDKQINMQNKCHLLIFQAYAQMWINNLLCNANTHTLTVKSEIVHLITLLHQLFWKKMFDLSIFFCKSSFIDKVVNVYFTYSLYSFKLLNFYSFSIYLIKENSTIKAISIQTTAEKLTVHFEN